MVPLWKLESCDGALLRYTEKWMRSELWLIFLNKWPWIRPSLTEHHITVVFLYFMSLMFQTQNRFQCYSFIIWLVLIVFHHCNKIFEMNSLKGRKIAYGSWFQSAGSMVCWLSYWTPWNWVITGAHETNKATNTRQKRGEKDRGRDGLQISPWS